MRANKALQPTVGVDCERWHDAMDELIVGPVGESEWDVVTTWHENETIEEVVEFARAFRIKSLAAEVWQRNAGW